MPLAADPRRLPHLIVGYDAAGVRLRDRLLSASTLLTPERIVDWPVRSVAELEGAALEALLGVGAEIVLLSTGPTQQFPAPAVLASAARAGIGLEVMDLGAACRTYNVLVADERPVALALILPGSR